MPGIANTEVQILKKVAGKDPATKESTNNLNVPL